MRLRLLISFSILIPEIFPLVIAQFPLLPSLSLPKPCPVAHTCSTSWNAFFDVSLSLKNNGGKIDFHKKWQHFEPIVSSLNFLPYTCVRHAVRPATDAPKEDSGLARSHHPSRCPSQCRRPAARSRERRGARDSECVKQRTYESRQHRSVSACSEHTH